MDPDLSALDEALDTWGVDGYLILATGDDADQRYLSGFGAPDQFHTLYDGEALHLLVRGLERGHARAKSRASTVATPEDYGRTQLAAEHGHTEAEHIVAARFLADHGVETVAVPSTFPLGSADGLREQEIAVHPDDEGTIQWIRAVKTQPEIDHIAVTQRATQTAMGLAQDMLAQSGIDGDRLVLDGEPLTSERIKEELEVSLLRNRCIAGEMIVASGADAADPHNRGSGVIRPHEPIVIDIFPHHRESKYHADMTRTFCVGEPSETAVEWYDLTLTALERALEMLEPGVPANIVHDAVCDVYEAAGIDTLRTNDTAETGFIHGTGHGIGLDVHESPRLSTQDYELEPGHVITVEPGVYHPSVGGIRIEDLVVITEDGNRNLTEYPKVFVV